MKGWNPRRVSAFAPGFDDDFALLGIDHWLWDHACADFEEVLLGADRELIDIVFPPGAGGLRLLLTKASSGLPALRIAFYLDDSDDEKVVYVGVARRS